MSLSVAVVGHIHRAEQAWTLAAQLDARIFIDDGTLGEWENHRRALAWCAGQRATHALILQDDAVPIDDGFLAHVGVAAMLRPNSPIGLYVGRQRPLERQVSRAVAEATASGAAWLVADRLLWGVATVFPTADLPALLAACEGGSKPYDQRVGSWYRKQRRPVSYTWPSLIDHADDDSLIDGRTPRPVGRIAHLVDVPNWSDVEVVIRR